MIGYRDCIETLVKTEHSRQFRFGLAVVTVYYDVSVVYTTMPGTGTPIKAIPQTDQAYLDRAKDLGYASADDMNREHDPLHSYLAVCMGLPFSPVLYAKAHNLDIPTKAVRDQEEALVLAFQRYLNTEVYSTVLDQIPFAEFVGIARKARELLR